MRWAVAVCGILVFALSLALGWWLGRERGEDDAAKAQSKRAATITVALCLVVIGLRLILKSSWEYALLGGWSDYALVRPWWPIPFALALLAAGSRHMSTENAQRLVLAFGIVLGVVSGYKLVATARFDPAEVTGQVGPNGVCMQSTDYTCGAAAAVMLLYHHGQTVSERDMAVDCWTNAFTGTDEFCVIRGLEKRLAGSGRVARLETPGWEGLVQRSEPAMATIKWSFFVDHWVLVREVTAQGVVINDPVRGQVVLSEGQFKDVWRGGLVTADLPAR